MVRLKEVGGQLALPGRAACIDELAEVRGGNAGARGDLAEGEVGWRVGVIGESEDDAV